MKYMLIHCLIQQTFFSSKSSTASTFAVLDLDVHCMDRNVLQNVLFYVPQKKVCNDMRASKWCQNDHVCVNCPFDSVCSLSLSSWPESVKPVPEVCVRVSVCSAPVTRAPVLSRPAALMLMISQRYNRKSYFSSHTLINITLMQLPTATHALALHYNMHNQPYNAS